MMDDIKIKRDNEIEAKVTAVEHTRRTRQRQLIAKNAEFEQRKKDKLKLIKHRAELELLKLEEQHLEKHMVHE